MRGQRTIRVFKLVRPRPHGSVPGRKPVTPRNSPTSPWPCGYPPSMGIGIGTAAANASDEGAVLAIVSNALRLPYDFADEVRRIHDSAAASRRFQVSAHWSCAPATIRRLLETKEPEVVHVLAPKVEEDGSLWLTDHKGNPLRIGLDETVALFTGLPRPPKLVVVNTCESYPVAQALAKCVGATIGMTGEILDHDAIAFADRLYQRLAAGAPLTEAFEDARLEVPRASRHVPLLLDGTADPAHLRVGGTAEDAERRVEPISRGVVKVFCSYAHEDSKHLESLMKFLAPLTRSGALGMWHDRLLEPGQNWAREIDDNIEGAALMVLLVSADFLESEYCIGIELQKALERHRSEANSMRVVPISSGRARGRWSPPSKSSRCFRAEPNR